MNIIKPEIFVENEINGIEILKHIEKIGRVCYKSEDSITADSAARFVKNIIKSGHESVIEHYSISVRIICDRGVTHEIVRHRIASYSQESTRYCNYSRDKFDNQITYIKPNFWCSENEGDKEKMKLWEETLSVIEKNYMKLVDLGATPQEARSILPNSLKTELVMTMNLREWRHFLRLRASKASHPQMREVAFLILNEFKGKIPVIFDDISAE
ncbi:thymidylate synthase ThyX [Oxobacter pfennigii]|uniref:FAD-dependent thymidylate synthase n=1 Tax=Oxobacter pfennigii TaxID=36849 RepID=A0A0P8WD09_9CLOT|nr:FAD-dependent thymidylate synthase [Oxobacter pfennigii]KPU45650.1 thymidylate synthase ThyX [Oxobacter pfennigii]